MVTLNAESQNEHKLQLQTDQNLFLITIKYLT